MLTPQDIKDKMFEKATFGGYDMTLVDDFLEQIHDDYTALYKDNAILKSKLKVLVEKVEEYRSTEDSMRMALLTAQKMGSEITEEAKKKGDAILAEVHEQAKRKEAELRRQYAAEEARLEEAKRHTGAFSKKVLDIIAEERAFLTRLGELVIETPGAPAEPVPVPPPVVYTPPVEVPVVAAAPVLESTPISPAELPSVEAAAGEPPVSDGTGDGEVSLDQMETSASAYLAREISSMMEEPPLTGVPQVPESFFDDAVSAASAGEAASYAAPTHTGPAGGEEEVEFYKLFDKDPEPAAEQAPLPPIFEEAAAVPKTPVPSIFEEVLAESAKPVPAKPAEAPPESPPVKPVDVRAEEKIDIARSISASLGDTEELKVDVDAFWDDEGTPTTTRPKFDFDNLQFGSNYDDDEA